MNNNAKLWVQELKSGKYEQTKCHLGGETTGYCCLGVACKVYEEVTGNIFPKEADGSFLEVEEDNEGAYDIHDSLTGPYAVVRDWLGLQDHEGTLPFDYPYKTLTSMNDSEIYTFEDIANTILEYEDYLFVSDKDGNR